MLWPGRPCAQSPQEQPVWSPGSAGFMRALLPNQGTLQLSTDSSTVPPPAGGGSACFPRDSGQEGMPHPSTIPWPPAANLVAWRDGGGVCPFLPSLLHLVKRRRGGIKACLCFHPNCASLPVPSSSQGREGLA